MKLNYQISMPNIVINYENVLNKIKQQFALIKSSKDIYNKLNFIVSDEQTIIKEQHVKPNTIFITVRFGSASINYGQAIVPTEIQVMGLQNDLRLTQSFLNDYVSEYNLNVDAEADITQLYVLPRAASNLNEVFTGYRTLFTISSTFLIGNNTIRLTSLTYYYGSGTSDHETITVLGYNDATENQVNPQPYPNTHGRTKSYGAFQTFAFNITIYPNGNSELVKKIMSWKFDETTNHQNDTFVFSGTFAHSNVNMPQWSFKCRSANFSEQIGNIPAMTLSFTL